MNGTLAVARYTLIELSRRRILVVFFVLGVLGIAVVGFGLKLFGSSFSSGISFGPPGSAPDPVKVNRFLELSFVSNLVGALGLFALLIAFAIGMTVIYHDLDSGAAVAIFSKPVSRLAFAVGKLMAAIAAMIAIVGLLSVEARLMMLLFGGGGDLQQTLWVEAAAQVANAIALMLIVMALSTWMNNIVAAVVGFIYHGVAGVAVLLHDQYQTGSFGHNDLLGAGFTALYWLVPHQLMSDAARQLARAEYDLFSSASTGGGNGPPPVDQVLAGIPGASGTADIIWWAFGILVFASLVYFAVRRRQV